MADLQAARLLTGRAARSGRVVRRRPGFGGSIGAILMFCASLTPSLLPRHWALQGVLSGITMAIGYGAGATVGALARTFWSGLPRPSRLAWTVLAGTGGVLAVVFLWLGASWQQEVRQLVGAQPGSAWEPLLVLVASAGVFALLLVASRAIRLATRTVAGAFGRFSPRPVASVAAVGLVAVLSYGIGQGVVFHGLLDVADRAAASANAATTGATARPSSPYVSGGPGSLVPWETLGSHGREFTAGATPRSELADFSGGDAEHPVRAYIGRELASDVDARANLAVRELERTGAFDRAVVALITTTGTGWVNPAAAQALEYLYAGDSALVAMQYSDLPSWISFVADRSAVAEAAEALISAVQQRLAAMPADQRPTLVVYGESLGAHGIEAACGDLDGLLAATDGALLVGPPHSSPIWGEVSSGRDADRPAGRATYEDGATVGFAQRAADLPAAATRPEVVYLQNASDPVVWWSPELLYRKPEWLGGARGQDVADAVQWQPVVTFWQVTVDLLTSTKAPSGHGHSYAGALADAWAAMIGPPGWTDADTAQLRTLLESGGTSGGPPLPVAAGDRPA